MLVDWFKKHSAESYTKTVSYADRLPSGVTISSATHQEARDLTFGTDVTATVIGTIAGTGTTVSIPVQAGTDGHNYLISFKATLSNGNVILDSVLMEVRDRPIA